MKTKFLHLLLTGIFISLASMANAQVIDSAGTLPLNTLKGGNLSGQVDVWKLTTNGDGAITVTISQNSADVHFDLYDHNGITLLSGGNHTDYSNTFTMDGLAAGTYYMHVYAAINQTTIYGITATLAQPSQANDAEPDSTFKQALTLPLNGSATGHIGYYYNNHKDSSDWYKIKTTADGMLTIHVNSGNNHSVFYTLYDHDATTQFWSTNTGYTTTISQDGLAPGIYYLKITYSTGDNSFAPYTVSDNLNTYNPVNPVPSKYFSDAPTLFSNDTASGHVGFYYNDQRDTFNTYKLNYTGTGNLSFSTNEFPHLGDGQYPGLHITIYGDTSAASVYDNNINSGTVNLTSLAKGYYYVRISIPFNNNFAAYTLSNTYTEITPSILVSDGTDTATDCSSTNTIVYKFSRINPPYTLQLFRFGQAYGTPKTVNKKTYTFSNLPDGIYYATATVDGASVSGLSKTIGMMAKPTGTNTTAITKSQAKFNWTSVSCADYYSVQYRVHGTTAWTTKKTIGNVNNIVIKGLTGSTNYEWHVAAVDSANNMNATSAYTDSVRFTTPASLVADENGDNESDLSKASAATGILIYPNPAINVLHVYFNTSNNNKPVAMQLKGVNGKTIWSTQKIESLKIDIDVSRFANGIYLLELIYGDKIPTTEKVFINR